MVTFNQFIKDYKYDETKLKDAPIFWESLSNNVANYLAKNGCVN